jgi:choice-of-anchor A domain-containing protein
MNLQNAAVRGNLLTMGDFSGTDGNASGKLELGGAAHLARFEVAKGVRKSANLALNANHASYAQALYLATAEYAALPARAPHVQGTVVSFNAKSAFNVFAITKENLQKTRLVNVNASANQVVVINVTGNGELAIDGMDIALRGGVASENVLWNFPRVSRLTIQRSGHSSASDRPGIQGTILAPYAVVNFREALLVGHLFVGLLDDWKGQVNVAPFFRCEDPSFGAVCAPIPDGPQEPFDPGSGK